VKLGLLLLLQSDSDFNRSIDTRLCISVAAIAYLDVDYNIPADAVAAM